MADNSLKKILKHYFKKIKTFFLSKDIFIFLLFFVFSAGLWFVNALGKERERIISIPLNYTGIPQHIAIVNNPPKSLSVKIKDEGMHLLQYRQKRLKPLDIYFSQIFYEKGKILITPDQISNYLLRYLQPTTLVLETKPDSIVVEYEKLSQKLLPVECKIKYSLAQQYMIVDKILLQPSKITVFGTAQQINSLKTLKTEPLLLSNLNDTVNTICRLQPIHGVRFTTEAIQVFIPIEKFTEKKVRLPIQVLNVPNYITIRTFPTQVEATFNIALSRFSSFDPAQIQLAVDYHQIKESASDKLQVFVIDHPSYVQNIRLSPQQVEFLVEKF
ncbi:MAG TPA: YbbR-like domain-containing protein [Paludibacteraceae bacterium]|jgi:hypothetical protein|nr:YbbR-like domain-containing protein [Paludibacteraceae bacterium]OPZ03113.1 MAG: YbbR-like protein [Bacteroidetes bacterium ADurb.BinA395]MBP8965817.1 YbbR-like domain-containing protein [Paludibacteraceae bacterium]HOF98024.1 YbbR-like domain-containing protein [Paludibacteraceae bacterium]HOJ65901.1 YbbR-like domain-containing protein [Paludibacteraceae bacterium]